MCDTQRQKEKEREREREILCSLIFITNIAYDAQEAPTRP